MKQLLPLAFTILFLASCSEKAPENKPHNDKVKFELPNTSEQVLKTNEDGSHQYSIFTDIHSNRKVAEVEFHPNGQPKIQKNFVNDTLNGESWCYYENGSPWSVNTFKSGLYDGLYKTWHDNGQLNITGFYKEGKEDGEWFTYYPNGVLNTRGLYRSGEKVGVWSSYNMQGTLRREQDFSKSK